MARGNPKFEDYKDAYSNIDLERSEDGVLVMRFNTGGESLVFSASFHEETAYCFNDIANDHDNEVVIITGTGDSYCTDVDIDSFELASVKEWDRNAIFEGRRLLMNFLEIEAPVIAAVNGPVIYHPEIPVMADIVLASTTAAFQDNPHFISGIVPGDGAHLIWPNLLGENRGRYFLLTGQTIGAAEALELGVVSEVLEPGALLPRAHELARFLVERPYLTRRYSRVALIQRMREMLVQGIGHGFAYEALAAVDQWPESGDMAK